MSECLHDRIATTGCFKTRVPNSSLKFLPRGMRKLRNQFFYSSRFGELGILFISFPGAWGITFQNFLKFLNLFENIKFRFNRHKLDLALESEISVTIFVPPFTTKSKSMSNQAINWKLIKKLWYKDLFKWIW